MMDEYHHKRRAVGEQFARIWRALAEAGVCDEYGGAEYQRVMWEWCEAGQPRPIAHSIRTAANRPPRPRPREAAPSSSRPSPATK